MKNIEQTTTLDNISKSKKELYNKTKDTYTATNGIKIKRTFNENGKDINESFKDYLKKCLEG